MDPTWRPRHAPRPALQHRARHSSRLFPPWRQDGDQARFVPMADNLRAFGVRLELIDAPEHSIDLQTFQVKPDLVTRLMFARLITAANRGVRVRLLVDDIFTSMSDTKFAVLDTHPNIEVRIFNPIMHGVPTPLGWLFGLPRSNRRMHDKALILNNAMAIEDET